MQTSNLPLHLETVGELHNGSKMAVVAADVWQDAMP